VWRDCRAVRAPPGDSPELDAGIERILLQNGDDALCGIRRAALLDRRRLAALDEMASRPLATKEIAMSRLHLQMLAAMTVLAAGCASGPKPAPTTALAPPAAGEAASPPAAPAPPETAPPTMSSVHIEERIIHACGDLPRAHFAFDSAKIQPDASAALTALASCFSTGPLAGKGMRLVGHADPRGEAEYNLALGQRRAGSVAAFEEEHGVGVSHLTATSRGAFDATGLDEEGWARDRRVDVFLED
jgi:peptidoglycan-associated lipoprotein